ncbi:CHAD domain-containing protein [Campylobacter sp. FMV-PI01]|uniref:CHAD domain-containing protein n=1 Tax=Campylobacter portucalensis TaxID=2608384 RepID=A0A6L5WG15_9BACT|nr:CHAD domain-containing protein [Campylobacter portucalensis]MSN95666.1 CHAD domain-containing protein [Campylobacter portucalensis]
MNRKFLLKNSDILDILFKNQIVVYKSKITKFYTKISKQTTISYKKRDNAYYLNETTNSLEPKNVEIMISKNQYKTAKKEKISRSIKKEHFSFKIENEEYFLDVFKSNLKGIVILEVKINSKIDANNFQFNEILKNIEKKEITSNSAYEDKYLCLYGDIEAKTNKSNSMKFLDYSDAYDNFKAITTQIYDEILKYKDEYLTTKNSEILHKIRVNIKKSRSLLKMSSDLYDPKISKIILENLKIAIKQTNHRHDFDVFINYLKKVPNSSQVIESLEFVANQKFFDVCKFIENEEMDDVLLDYEILLKDSNKIYATNKFMMKKFVALTLRKEIVKLEKKLFKLSDESQNKSFHKVRFQIQNINYLFENFIEMFGLKSFEKCYKMSKDIEKLFQNLKDQDAWCHIISMYDKGEIHQFLTTQKDEISIKMFELRGEILEKKDKFMKKISKISKILKAYY